MRVEQRVDRNTGEVYKSTVLTDEDLAPVYRALKKERRAQVFNIKHPYLALVVSIIALISSIFAPILRGFLATML